MLEFVIVCVAVILVIGLAVSIYKESKEFCITFYDYSSEKILMDEYKLVFLSDLHSKVFPYENQPLLDAIEEMKPDAVVFAGDMVNASGKIPLDYEPTLEFIKKLSAKYPIYYGIGNHEEKLKRSTHLSKTNFEHYTDALSKLGVHIMENEVAHISQAGIDIYGLILEHKYYKKGITRHIPKEYMESSLGKVNKERYSILLAHNPDQFPGYAEWKPDLVLSGHIHGGIVQLPIVGGVVSPQWKLFPKYDAGEFHAKETIMILSRGIGSHTIPLRIWNRAEIVCIRIRKKEVINNAG